MFFWNSLAFLMIQQMLVIWSLVPLPFLKPAWTSGSSWFTYCWSLAWRILSVFLCICWFWIIELIICIIGFPHASMVKTLPAKSEMQIWFLGWEDVLKKDMATHSRILLGEFCGQRSLGDYSPWSHKRIRHDLVTKQLQGHSH